MTRLTFVVPLVCKLPTPNSRLHWAAKARLTKQLRDTAMIVGRSKRQGPPASEPVTMHLTLIRGKGQKMLDPDNAVASVKATLDGLIAAGLAKDDSPRWLTLTVDQEKGAAPAVRVTVGA